VVVAAAVVQSEHAAAAAVAVVAAVAAAVVAAIAAAHTELVVDAGSESLDDARSCFHGRALPLLETPPHNGEILAVVVTICNQPTLKEIVSLEQNLNECRVLLTGKRERVNLSSRANVCKVSKRA
jgi:hypothetical protein